MIYYGLEVIYLMSMKIYTKTGDQGETSLYSGKRVMKDDPIIEAVGTLDECNSAIGIATSTNPFLGLSHFLYTQDQMDRIHEVKKSLLRVQHALFDIGAHVATPRTITNERKLERTSFDENEVSSLEKEIDSITEKLEPLRTFILPGGCSVASSLHLARTIARRAERCLIPLCREHLIDPSVLVYMNRLSDYLFIMARYVNFIMQCDEVKWSPHKGDS